MKNQKTFNLDRLRGKSQAEKRGIEGSVLELQASLTNDEAERSTDLAAREHSAREYESSIWSTVVDIRICEDFAAIKYINGKKILHQRKEIEQTALYALYRDMVKRHQPQETVVAKDFSVEWGGGRWRGQIYHCNSGWMIALRQMPYKLPVLRNLGVNADEVSGLASGSGLVLFAGPIGAGKSTSMAATVYDLMGKNLLGDTVTIEEPIEFLYDDPFIQQREVGVDVQTFAAGIHEAMRQSPETIVIGEIRHRETAEIAIQAGLTGHRVMATIHAESVNEACSRMFSLLGDSYNDLLPRAMQGVMAQHLIRKAQGRIITVYETLKFDRAAKNVLSSGPDALPRLVHEQFRQGRKTLKDSAREKLAKGLIDRDTASRWVEDGS